MLTVQSVQSGQVSAVAWLDNKVVMSMYTGFSPLDKAVVQRRQKTGERIAIPCSSAVCFLQ